MPENVKILSHKHPETVIVEDHGVAIHGQSFSSKAVTEDLSAAYPEPIPGLFNIGLLHTCADGRAGHEPYAPCSMDALITKGYHYWALGHVHTHMIMNEHPLIAFSGNVQGRHVRETGPKGCILATMEDGKLVSIDYHELGILRWTLVRIDVTGAATGEEVVDRTINIVQRELTENQEIPLAARIEIFGSCKAHVDLAHDSDRWISEIRSGATDMSSGKVWLEKVKFKTQTEIDVGQAAKRDDALGGLLRTISQLESKDDDLAVIMTDFEDLRQKLPAELRTGEESIELENPEIFSRALEDVRQLLVARILSKENVE
jgi:DNA repair exonuclease SbcCD nuclease subunit